MKKIVLSMVCLIMIFACSAIAEEEPTVCKIGDYSYSYILLEDGTAEITDFKRGSQKESKLIISGELDGHAVTSIGERAFYDLRVEEIVIPDGVKSIGDYAFENCTKLTEITLPDSVRFIGRNVFRSCVSLTKINVSLDHPTLATIDGVLFDKTEKKLIFYPQVFTEESYTIPRGIASIGDFAFDWCDSLKEIIIPDSVTFIGDYAFMRCSSLIEITIPDSVTSVGDGPFAYCDGLKINVSPDHPTLVLIDGVLFDKKEKTLIMYPGSLTAESYSIPESIPNAEDKMSFWFGGLTKSSGLNSVTAIGDYAFWLCTNLEEIIIPSSVTSIGDSAFQECVKLQEIAIPNSVTSIGNYAFSHCASLEEIIIPSSVTSIGYRAFYECSNLKEIAIPNSVTSIGEGTFLGCRNLKKVAIPSSVTSIGDHAFTYSSDMIFTVDRDSYALQYVKENGYEYMYTDALDWLNS